MGRVYQLLATWYLILFIVAPCQGQSINNVLGNSAFVGKNALFASQNGAKLNSVLGTNQDIGSDDSRAIQKMLDANKTTGLPNWVIIDGPARISTNLIIHSNTKLQCTPGAGFHMSSNAACPIIISDLNTNISSHDITIEGGYYDGNRTNQPVTLYDSARLFPNGPGTGAGNGTNIWLPVIWLGGVSNLLVKDVNFSTSTWGPLFTDTKQCKIINCLVRDDYPAWVNGDGLHFISGNYDLTIDNYKVFNMSSDALAINIGEEGSWGLPAESRYSQQHVLSNLVVNAFEATAAANSTANFIRIGWGSIPVKYYNLRFSNLKCNGRFTQIFACQVGGMSGCNSFMLDGLEACPSGTLNLLDPGSVFNLDVETTDRVIVRGVNILRNNSILSVPDFYFLNDTNVVVSDCVFHYLSGATGGTSGAIDAEGCGAILLQNISQVGGDGFFLPVSGAVSSTDTELILADNINCSAPLNSQGWTNFFVSTYYNVLLNTQTNSTLFTSSTNTLTVNSGGVTNNTKNNYLLTITAGTGLALKDGNGNGILNPVLNETFPLKPGWRFSGTAGTVTGQAIAQ